MKTAIPTVTKNRCLADAFHLLQEKSAPAVAIVDGLGRLVGLVTPETVGECFIGRCRKGRFGPWGPTIGRSADTPAR